MKKTFPSTFFNLSTKEIAQGEADYFSLSNPTVDQRFQFRRWKSQILSYALENNVAAVVEDFNEGRTDFGMDTNSMTIKFEDWSKDSNFSSNGYP
ncbi:MAG: hypothetical protein V4736_07425, partial [Bdellovibrionota bacterium]